MGWRRARYLRLRSFKQTGIPNAGEWPALIVPKLALEPPDGWMHELLNDGRALVLIDGVDEVSLLHRKQLLESLGELVTIYPLARNVIASRPAAIKNWPEWSDWMRTAGFVTATLQEMEQEQVFTFIDRWHEALLASTPQAEELAKIRQLPAALKQLLRQRRPLRQLARNPLLCTMICALHRERPNNMPQNRVKLYQDCVEMLLYKRDTEREIGSMVDYPSLTHTHEEVVLRDYAHHLLLNGESEEAVDEADAYFDQLLESIQMPDWTGTKLRDYFVKRTGLLIEPADGRIAFTHRTFQEFLAARVIVKKNEISMLLDKARDDQWRETILLTVALPEISEKQSEKLFRGLLKKADGLATPRSRHELYLLAVACLECPIYLSSALRQEVLARAAALIPPRSQDDVLLIAKAGDPVVELLQYDPRYSYAKMARCVDTLAEIGSERALLTIAAYSASAAYAEVDSEDLHQAIGAAMWRFNVNEYCRCVLGKTTTLFLVSSRWTYAGLRELVTGQARPDPRVKPASDGRLKELTTLNSLTGLSLCYNHVDDTWLEDLSSLTNLRRLWLYGTQVSSFGLKQLRALTNLEWLSLESTFVDDAGLKELATLINLEWLNLSSTQVSDAGLKELTALPSLRRLLLNSTQVSNAGLRELSALTSLEWLFLNATTVGDAGLKELAVIPSLQRLVVSSTQVSNTGLKTLATFPELCMLFLDFTQVSDVGLKELVTLPNLRRLSLSSTQVTDAGLKELAALTNLKLLSLDSTQVTDAGLHGLAPLTNLEWLDLGSTQVTDAGLHGLASLTNLEWLDLSSTQVSDAGLKELASHPAVKTLNLSSTQVSDAGLKELVALTNLESLDLGSTQVSDAGLVHLSGLGSLRELYLRNTQVRDTSALDHLLGLEIRL